MKKQLLGIFAIFAIGAFLFTSCETDDPVITIEGDDPLVLDLGQEFECPGFSVEHGDEEDVTIDFTPAFDKHLVNEYIATYRLGSVTAERTVWVRSNELTGDYSVTVSEEGYDDFDYIMDVRQASNEYNVIRLIDFAAYATPIEVRATINGDVITIPKQTPVSEADWGDDTVEGTGTYDGENKVLLEIEYRTVEGGTVYEGTITFNEKL